MGNNNSAGLIDNESTDHDVSQTPHNELLREELERVRAEAALLKVQFIEHQRPWFLKPIVFIPWVIALGGIITGFMQARTEKERGELEVQKLEIRLKYLDKDLTDQVTKLQTAKDELSKAVLAKEEIEKARSITEKEIAKKEELLKVLSDELAKASDMKEAVLKDAEKVQNSSKQLAANVSNSESRAELKQQATTLMNDNDALAASIRRAETKTPGEQALGALYNYFDAVNKRDAQAAYNSFSAKWRSKHTLQNFEKIFNDTKSMALLSQQIDSITPGILATVKARFTTVTRSGKSEHWTGTFPLVYEDGTWKFSEFKPELEKLK